MRTSFILASCLGALLLSSCGTTIPSPQINSEKAREATLVDRSGNLDDPEALRLFEENMKNAEIVSGGIFPLEHLRTMEMNGLSHDTVRALNVSCTNITFHGLSGYISVQTSPTGYLQWGIYMYNAAENAGPWWVSVYLDGVLRDYKSPPRQVYAPHGSFPPQIAMSGMYFNIVASHTSLTGQSYGNIPNGCVVP